MTVRQFLDDLSGWFERSGRADEPVNASTVLAIVIKVSELGRITLGAKS